MTENLLEISKHTFRIAIDTILIVPNNVNTRKLVSVISVQIMQYAK